MRCADCGHPIRYLRDRYAALYPVLDGWRLGPPCYLCDECWRLPAGHAVMLSLPVGERG